MKVGVLYTFWTLSANVNKNIRLKRSSLDMTVPFEYQRFTAHKLHDFSIGLICSNHPLLFINQ